MNNYTMMPLAVLGIQCAFELAERCKTCGSDQATILDFVSSVAWIDIGKAVTVFKFTICKSLMKSLYALARRRHLQASTAITIATSYTKTMVGCAPVSKKLTKFIERTFKLHTTVHRHCWYWAIGPGNNGIVGIGPGNNWYSYSLSSLLQ